MQLNFILRKYKEAFADEFVWIVLKDHLQKLLETVRGNGYVVHDRH